MFGMSMRRLLLVGGAMSAAMLGQEAVAQDADAGGTLEEIVVTARRREENLQTTPVAITAVTNETLERRNIVTLEGISRLAPSLQVYQTSGGLGSAGTFMRGIGYADNIPGQDSPIGVYVDGVIAGRNGVAMMTLVEPQRVEVLRGPQGTLFGRNTTGGAILITSHVPSDEFSGMVKASYGTYHDRRFQGRVDSGLLGESGIKFSFAYMNQNRDGTFNAIGRPRDQDPGALTNDAYWFKAVGEWDKFSASLVADYNEIEGVPTPLQVIDATANVRSFVARSVSLGGLPYTITTDPLYTLYDATRGTQRIWQSGVSLTLNYEVNDYITLKSISSVRAYKRHDPSAYGPPNLTGQVVAPGTPRIATFDGLYSLFDRWQSQRQRSQEFQISGSAGDFDYVAGAYYFKEGAWDAGLTRLPSVLSATTAFEFIDPRLYTVDSKSIAGFAQVDWRPSMFDKKLELTGGVRWTKDKREFEQFRSIARAADLSTKNTSFLVSANYQWTENAMTFARYSTGYRAGGFNARATATANPVFEPEKLKSIEVGFKVDMLGNRVRLNGAAYSNKYKGLQSGAFVAPSGGQAGGNVAINTNAKYKGFELELQAVPTDGLTLTASVGYVDPEYTSYPRALDPGGRLTAGCVPATGAAAATTQNCAEIADFLYFPNTTADFTITYVLPATSYGEWSFYAGYSWKSKMESATFRLPASPFHDVIQQKGYGLLNARIELSDIPLAGGDVRGQLALFGDNLTNEKYSIQGIDFATFATKSFGTRRTVGLEGKVSF
jgi:iron complex outermembrane receptor protein